MNKLSPEKLARVLLSEFASQLIGVAIYHSNSKDDMLIIPVTYWASKLLARYHAI